MKLMFTQKGQQGSYMDMEVPANKVRIEKWKKKKKEQTIGRTKKNQDCNSVEYNLLILFIVFSSQSLTYGSRNFISLAFPFSMFALLNLK